MVNFVFACFLCQFLCQIPSIELTVVRENNPVNSRNSTHKREILQKHFSLTFRMEVMIKNSMNGNSFHESVINTGKESFMHLLDSKGDLNYLLSVENANKSNLIYTFESVITVEAKDMHNEIDRNFPNTIFFIFKPKVRECISHESIKSYYTKIGKRINISTISKDNFFIDGEKYQRCTEYYNLEYMYMNFSLSEVKNKNITKDLVQKCENCSNCVTTEWGSFFFSLESKGDIYILNDVIFIVAGVIVALLGSVFGFFVLCIVNPLLLKCLIDPRRKNRKSDLNSCCLISFIDYLINLYNGIMCSGCGLLLGCVYETTFWNYSSLIFLYSDWFSKFGFVNPFFMTGNFFLLERVWIQSMVSVITSVTISTILFFFCTIGAIVQCFKLGLCKLDIKKKYNKKKIMRIIEDDSIKLEEIEEVFHKSPQKMKNNITQKIMLDSENFVTTTSTLKNERMFFNVLESNEYFKGKKEIFFDKKEKVVVTNGKTISTIKMLNNNSLMKNQIVEFQEIKNIKLTDDFAEFILFISLAGGTFKKGEYSFFYRQLIHDLRENFIKKGISYIKKGNENEKLKMLQKKEFYYSVSHFFLFFSSGVVDKILEEKRKKEIINFKIQVESKRYGFFWDLMDMELCRTIYQILSDFYLKMDKLFGKKRKSISIKKLKIRNIEIISNYLKDIQNLGIINTNKICKTRIFNPKVEKGNNSASSRILKIYDKIIEMIKRKLDDGLVKLLEINKNNGLRIPEIKELCKNEIFKEILKSSKKAFTRKILIEESIDPKKKKAISELKDKCSNILDMMKENKDKIKILSRVLDEFFPMFQDYLKLFSKIKIRINPGENGEKILLEKIYKNEVFKRIKKILKNYQNLHSTIIFVFRIIELIEKNNKFNGLKKNICSFSSEKENRCTIELPKVIKGFVDEINLLTKEKEKVYRKKISQEICNNYQDKINKMIKIQSKEYLIKNFESKMEKFKILEEKYKKIENTPIFHFKEWVLVYQNHIVGEIEKNKKNITEKEISKIEIKLNKAKKIIGKTKKNIEEIEENTETLFNKFDEMENVLKEFILLLWDQNFLNNAKNDIELIFKDLKGERIYTEILDTIEKNKKIKSINQNRITKKIFYFQSIMGINDLEYLRNILHSFFREIVKWLKFYSFFYFDSIIKSRDYSIEKFFKNKKNFMKIDIKSNKKVFVEVNNNSMKNKNNILFLLSPPKVFDEEINKYMKIKEQLTFGKKDLKMKIKYQELMNFYA